MPDAEARACATRDAVQQFVEGARLRFPVFIEADAMGFVWLSVDLATWSTASIGLKPAFGASGSRAWAVIDRQWRCLAGREDPMGLGEAAAFVVMELRSLHGAASMAMRPRMPCPA